MPDPTTPRSPARIRTLARRAKVLEMRVAGRPLQEIASTLGYASVKGVKKALDRAMLELREMGFEAAEIIRSEQLELLNTLTKELYPLATRSVQVDPETGEITGGPSMAAVDRLLRIVELRDKLLGLARPQQIDVHHTIEEMESVRARRWEAMQHALIAAGGLSALTDGHVIEGVFTDEHTPQEGVGGADGTLPTPPPGGVAVGVDDGRGEGTVDEHTNTQQGGGGGGGDVLSDDALDADAQDAVPLGGGTPTTTPPTHTPPMREGVGVRVSDDDTHTREGESDSPREQAWPERGAFDEDEAAIKRERDARRDSR